VINRYSHPTFAWILDYWPSTIFLPTILLLLVVLALITRSWAERDAACRAEPEDAGPTEAPRSLMHDAEPAPADLP
jgi:hypothetical protein